MEIVIINDALFLENSPLKENTIITKFVPYLNIAQKIYIEKLLGTPLMRELKEQVKDADNGNENSITPANQALIEIVAPALSFYAIYQGLPFHWAAIVNKGVTVRESENSKAVDVDDISQLRRWILNDAQTLECNIVEYLCRCRSEYPLWQPERGCGCGDCSEYQPTSGTTKTTQDTGIYIPKPNKLKIY